MAAKKTQNKRKTEIVPEKEPKKAAAKKAARAEKTASKPENKPAKIPAKKSAPAAVKSKAKPAPKKPVKKERKPHATRPTAEEEIKILERRYLVWDLYKAGASFRQISEHLKSKGIESASVGTVHADLQFILSLQHTDLEFDVKSHIENEVAIVNDVQFSFYSTMRNAQMPLDARLDAGAMVLNCVKERSKLRNLYKLNVEVKLNVEDELAKLLGLDPEELPDSVNQPEH